MTMSTWLVAGAYSVGKILALQSQRFNPVNMGNGNGTEAIGDHFFFLPPNTFHIRSHKIPTPSHACEDETAGKLYFLIALTTVSICSAVSSGYIGNETIRSAAASVTGNIPRV